MHPHLESYLRRVENQLKNLSVEQRAEELRELGQHLQALVQEGQESGLSQSEAVQAALAQFGPYRRVGRELNKAGSNGTTQHLPRAFSVMTAIMFGQAVLTFFLFFMTLKTRIHFFAAGWGVEQYALYLGQIVLPWCLSIVAAISLRHVRPWAFWLALALSGKNVIDVVQRLAYLPRHIPLDLLGCVALLWICCQPFCLAVLILNGKTYFRLARERRRA